MDREVADRGVAWFGDAAILVEPLPSEDLHALADALRSVEGVDDVLPGSLVLVRAAPGSIQSVREAVSSIPAQAPRALTRRVVEIPVVFDGPDLPEVASAAGTSEQGVAGMMAAAELRVAYLGFSPGFPYIVGLPEELTRLGRRSAPRTSVAAGSVGVAAGYLGVYPQASPGGWNLLGRTDLAMFDPLVPPYAALRHGDIVRIFPVDSLPSVPVNPPGSSGGTERPRCASPRRLVVDSPGVLTTLQDHGRIGVGHLGVPRAGPADPDLMRLANLVAGNDTGAGVLETTVDGPVIRFDSPAHVVVLGARLRVDGRELEPGVVVPVEGGQRVDVGTSPGLRGYLAVSGGIRGPELFGSCSSDLLSGLGIGALRSGDELALGVPGHPRGYATAIERNKTIRVVATRQSSGRPRREVIEELTSRNFTVEPDSNRVGARLRGDRQLPSGDDTSGRAPLLGSYGMVEGAVQLPPSGEPIVLLCDHATMGGYPVVVTVISADIGSLAQKRPGDSVQFELVDIDEARRARAVLDRELERSPVGLYPQGSEESL